MGEIWVPVGGKRHLMMLHLFDIEKARKFVPHGLDIVTCLPGKTIGSTFLSYYGPESTLEYHEFFIMPALVNVNGTKGFWVSHAYVDNEKSNIGGRQLYGLPKEMAEFVWQGTQPDTAVISQDRVPLVEICYGKALGAFRCWVKGPAVSVKDDLVIYTRSRFQADYGLCKVQYKIPATSPIRDDLNRLGFNQPIAALSGKNMRGFMAETTQVAAFPAKSKGTEKASRICGSSGRK